MMSPSERAGTHPRRQILGPDGGGKQRPWPAAEVHPEGPKGPFFLRSPQGSAEPPVPRRKKRPRSAASRGESGKRSQPRSVLRSPAGKPSAEDMMARNDRFVKKKTKKKIRFGPCADRACRYRGLARGCPSLGGGYRDQPSTIMIRRNDRFVKKKKMFGLRAMFSRSVSMRQSGP